MTRRTLRAVGALALVGSLSSILALSCSARTAVEPSADADGSADAAFQGSDGATEEGPFVRFVAMGDTGKGNDGQREVAAAVKAKCARDGCDFVQLLGDNIYDSGVESPSDALWRERFEEPYAAVDLPFWAVLGNHDYGASGYGTEFERGAHQVAYSKVSKKWNMPAAHWARELGTVSLVGLDTNLQMFGRDEEQRRDVARFMAEAKGTWTIAFGHHPYLSNGIHGNAGAYDGRAGVEDIDGARVKSFLEELVCGKAQLYIAAHDHDRQYLEGTCKGTELVVSGTGAEGRVLLGDNPSRFQTTDLGFVYVRASKRALTVQMVAVSGAVEFERTITK